MIVLQSKPFATPALTCTIRLLFPIPCSNSAMRAPSSLDESIRWFSGSLKMISSSPDPIDQLKEASVQASKLAASPCKPVLLLLLLSKLVRRATATAATDSWSACLTAGGEGLRKGQAFRA